ncbi:hypothetical protein FJT64_003615 [Amphibalanus amphitrite]|uniref:Uncharacterized protein n=1 Tax=Amphibalanus amphitrite TaxID=1232801 RepID=A0A6A4VW67_AMPAM|nr:hypothetical protein FJT64_003615 [Amphibalanus amphitrite]
MSCLAYKVSKSRCCVGSGCGDVGGEFGLAASLVARYEFVSPSDRRPAPRSEWELLLLLLAAYVSLGRRA